MMQQHRGQLQQQQQQPSGSAATSATAREAYVDIRVCELVIQQGTMPNTIDGGFQIDGLYLVLRCQDEVRRTSCLWTSAAKPGSTAAQQLRDGTAGEEDADDDDLAWNELFRFAVPPEQPTAARQPSQQTMSQQESQGSGSAGFAAATAPYTPPLAPRGGVSGHYGSMHAPPMNPSAGLSPPPHRSAAPAVPHSSPDGTLSPSLADSRSPLHHPAIELELWRSTPLSEHLLGCCTYYVPMELLHGGYDVAHLDTIAERVVRLRTKEAPSIMGNLYGWSGHRLSLRLRVQAVGLAPLPPAVWMPAAQSTGYATAASATVGAAVGMYPGQLYPGVYTGAHMGAVRPSMYGPGPGSGGDLYGAPMGTLNPVLANLLAPLGVSTPGPGGSYGPPPAGMGIPHWSGGGRDGTNGVPKPGQPPVFTMFPSTYAHGGVGPGGGSGGNGSGIPPASSGQGILGDGDPAWQSSAAPPPMFPPYGQHLQPH